MRRKIKDKVLETKLLTGEEVSYRAYVAAKLSYLTGEVQELKKQQTVGAEERMRVLASIREQIRQIHLDVATLSRVQVPAPQLMMRETLDKEGKVMTREFIPVRRSAVL